MISLANWQYILLRWPSNGIYRTKRRTDGPPPVQASSLDVVGSDSWSNAAPPKFTLANGEVYIFAFWSVIGADSLSPQREAHLDFGRNASSSHPGDAAMGGGSWIITAKAFYVRDIGLGGGNHAVLIDAFDVQAGDFIADDFVDVVPDDNKKSLTKDANNGYIDTTTQIAAGKELKITARQMLPTAKKFAYWQEVPSQVISANPLLPATVGAPDPHDIVAHPNDIIVAFAFYDEVPPQVIGPIILHTFPNILWRGIQYDAPRPIGWPWTREFASLLELTATANTVSPVLRPAVLQIVLQQLTITANLIKKDIKNKGK